MRTLAALPSRLRRAMRRLSRDESAFSAVEFGLVLPILVTVGLYGLEIAWMRLSYMQTSELALTVADNASRLGQTDNSSIVPTVAETDIDAVLFGAAQQGKNLDLATRGKVILSSLERDAGQDRTGGTNKQFIHWQRCFGALARSSAYGNDSNKNGLTGPVLNGMGRSGNLVTANTDQAVMFVEVYLTYKPLFGSMFVGNTVFKQESAFIVRDGRDLKRTTDRGTTGTIRSTCA